MPDLFVGRRLRTDVSQGGVAGPRETKQAIRDWKENLDRKASGELFSKGTVALQGAMESQVSLELERLKECLAKIK